MSNWVDKDGFVISEETISAVLAEREKRIADLEAQIKAKEQECEGLRAEVERRKLKWQSGKIPTEGSYYVKLRTGNLVYRLFPGDHPRTPWAGPIEPPEE
jgi:hypothetical protein